MVKGQQSTVSMRPQLSDTASTADGKMNQDFKRNVPRDASAVQDAGKSFPSLQSSYLVHIRKLASFLAKHFSK